MINNQTPKKAIKVEGISSGFSGEYNSLPVFASANVMSDRISEFQWDLALEVWRRGEYYQMFYNNICSLLMVLLKIINNERNGYHECSLSSMSQLYKHGVYIKFIVLCKSLLNTIKGLHFCNNMQIDHLIYLQTYQNKVPIGYLGSSKQNPFRSLLLTFYNC